MKYDKLKQLVGKVVSISPHATMGDGVPKYFVPAEGVPTNVVPVKSAPTNVVPTKPVPVKSAPTNVVPVKSVPTNVVPTKPVPVKSAPTNVVPVKSVPTNVVPTKPVPTKPVPVKSVPTKLVPTNHVPTFKSTEIELVRKDVKRLITSVEIDTTIDKSYLESLPKSEKLLYVANRGWRLNTELRGNQLYDYAVKYINRKKQRIYLGKTEI
jgi:hypothetical protein